MSFARPLADAFWRSVYRFGYPCARLVWRFTRPTSQGVSVAVRHGGRLLCIEESYRPGLGLPGGGIGRGETPLEAAQRELREEVGLDFPADAFAELGHLEFRAHHRLHHITFFALDPPTLPEPAVDRREVVWSGWLAKAELSGKEQQPALRRYVRHFAPDR